MLERDRKVLVVEDDFFQAQEICRFVEGTGGEVVGPVGTLERGLEIAHLADAAVLDINLNGSPVFPLADTLQARDVPIVFYTGATDIDMPARFWGIPMVRKPFKTLSDAAIVTISTFARDAEDDMSVVLPKLRLAARLIYNDPNVADRLVERLLEDAVAWVKSGKRLETGREGSRWLMERMQWILRDHGQDLMN
ncbi:MAG: hypothetical protein ACU0DK_17490 [Pseudooceanicola sp.]